MTTTENNSINHDAQFVIQRLYLKDASFEVPHAPQVFQQAWQPELTLDLHTEHTLLEQHIYEVILTVTTTVKNKESVAFIAEVKQAGIFTVQGVEGEALEHLLKSFCPNILFPYAREAITAQVTRGSFPQLVLAPVNFDALYIQQKQESNQTELETAH